MFDPQNNLCLTFRLWPRPIKAICDSPVMRSLTYCPWRNLLFYCCWGFFFLIYVVLIKKMPFLIFEMSGDISVHLKSIFTALKKRHL